MSSKKPFDISNLVQDRGFYMSNVSDRWAGGVYQEVVKTFLLYNSVGDTADAVGISKVKVQKILLTEGLWSSKTSRVIGKLYHEGLSSIEIAKRLDITVKNVQAYIPYSRGEYESMLTGDAKRCKKYRERIRCCSLLREEKTPNALWNTVVAFQQYPFLTEKGIRFRYVIRDHEMMMTTENRCFTISREAVVSAYYEGDRSMERFPVSDEYRVCLCAMINRWNNATV